MPESPGRPLGAADGGLAEVPGIPAGGFAGVGGRPGGAPAAGSTGAVAGGWTKGSATAPPGAEDGGFACGFLAERLRPLRGRRGVRGSGAAPPGAIHPRRHIDDMGVDGIGSDALGSEVAGLPELIMHRSPCLLRIVPAIRAAHIRAQISQSALDPAKNDAGNKASGSHFDALPDVKGGPRAS